MLYIGALSNIGRQTDAPPLITLHFGTGFKDVSIQSRNKSTDYLKSPFFFFFFFFEQMQKCTIFLYPIKLQIEID